MNILPKNDGFTLAEIITVIIIIGVLAGLALPRFGGTIERVKAAEGVQMLTALLGAQKTYFFETGAYATNAQIGQLDVQIDRAANFDIPPTVANNAAQVAQITRTGGYTLNIDEFGVITCIDVGAITCAKAGH